MNNHMEQRKMLNWISMISFSIVEITLYLDTHPKDTEALEYFHHLSKLRTQALKEYASNYGPLIIDVFHPEDNWCWATQPWPWEGGACGCGSMKNGSNFR